MKRLSTAVGATLGFGYMDGPMDHFNFQGPAYQFVGIDEACNIRENQALYMFSRLRRLIHSSIPIRFRCASNPPAPEQLARGKWVYNRYVDPATKKPHRIFIPAKLQDNPYLDQESYVESLNQLDPITRAQLLLGDWEIKVKGRMFDRDWFQVVDQPPADAVRVRRWDLAATEPSNANKDPDWTAGVKMSVTTTGLYFIEHVDRFRLTALATKERVKRNAEIDGKRTNIVVEQEPGSAGKIVVDDYIRLLAGYVTEGKKSSGSKRQRAMPFASQAEAGNVYIVNGSWNQDFLDELEIFPDGGHDDQVDAVSGAFDDLVGGGDSDVRWL